MNVGPSGVARRGGSGCKRAPQISDFNDDPCHRPRLTPKFGSAASSGAGGTTCQNPSSGGGGSGQILGNPPPDLGPILSGPPPLGSQGYPTHGPVCLCLFVSVCVFLCLSRSVFVCLCLFSVPQLCPELRRFWRCWPIWAQIRPEMDDVGKKAAIAMSTHLWWHGSTLGRCRQSSATCGAWDFAESVDGSDVPHPPPLGISGRRRRFSGVAGPQWVPPIATTSKRVSECRFLRALGRARGRPGPPNCAQRRSGRRSARRRSAEVTEVAATAVEGKGGREAPRPTHQAT